MEKSLESAMTEAKISLCDWCNANATTGIGSDDSTARVITIIEATDELDGNAVMSSNTAFGGGGDRRLSKRDAEAASLAGNETADGDGRWWPDEAVVRANALEPSKPVPIRRRDVYGVDGPTDMTVAIMEQRADYDADEEFRAADVLGYDADRVQVPSDYADGEDEQRSNDGDDGDNSDHNSHYEYVPMEFDDEGNHRLVVRRFRMMVGRGESLRVNRHIRTGL